MTGRHVPFTIGVSSCVLDNPREVGKFDQYKNISSAPINKAGILTSRKAVHDVELIEHDFFLLQGAAGFISKSPLPPSRVKWAAPSATPGSFSPQSLRLLRRRANARNVSHTPNRTAEKHTIFSLLANATKKPSFFQN